MDGNGRYDSLAWQCACARSKKASHTPSNKNLAVDAEINAVTCVWRFHIWERGS